MSKLPRQSDLFGSPEPPPARPRRRAAAPAAETPVPAAPVTLAELAAHATRPELDELVAALDDAGLTHVALASVRALRRRGGRQAARAAKLLADELGQTPDEEWA